MEDPLKKIQKEKERLLKLRDGEKPAEGDANQDANDQGNTDKAPEGTDGVVEQKPDVTPPELKTEDETFKHKYDVLLGKYNAEVPRLHAQVRDLTKEIDVLKGQLAQPKPPVADLPPLKDRDDEGNVLYRSVHVTDEMRATPAYRYMFQEYGQNYAENQFEMSVLTAQNTVKPVQQQVEQVSVQTDLDKFETALAGAVPDWQAINVDPEFIAWLQNAAPGTGATFYELVNDAYNSMNLQRTAEIFNLFKELNKKPTPQPKPEIPPHLQSPPKTGGGSQTVIDNNQGQVMRLSDWQKLNQDFINGLYRGKGKEYDAKKREFYQAKAEGRLIP